MEHYINPAKTALTVGAFIGGWHVIWSILVALGVAQGIVDFALWMHMINLPYAVKAFDSSAAATLIIVTAIMGYVVGYLFANIWNRMHRD